MNNQVALIIPCYNEEFRFPLELWRDIVSSNGYITFVFVDDGSSDSTQDLLKGLDSNPNFELVAYSKNSGKGNAVRRGFQFAMSNYSEMTFVGFVDSDGAFSSSDINLQVNMLLNLSEQHPDEIPDVFLSSRVALAGRAIHRKPSRHYLGRLIATTLTRGWLDAPYDTQSGFKLFHISPAFRQAIAKDFLTKWFFDIEILMRIATFQNGIIRLWEEPLNYWKDVDGSKIKVWHFFRIIAEFNYVRKQVKKFLELRRNLHGSH